jgi:predicted transcriptional regulator
MSQTSSDEYKYLNLARQRRTKCQHYINQNNAALAKTLINKNREYYLNLIKNSLSGSRYVSSFDKENKITHAHRHFRHLVKLGLISREKRYLNNNCTKSIYCYIDK